LHNMPGREKNEELPFGVCMPVNGAYLL